MAFAPRLTGSGPRPPYRPKRARLLVDARLSKGGEYVGMEVGLEDRASGERVWSSFAAETYDESLEAGTEIPKAADFIFESYPPK